MEKCEKRSKEENKKKKEKGVRDREGGAWLFSSSSLYKEFEEMMKKETEE